MQVSTFNYSPKRAFTLAEVLITLGVIGVVAAMTMPVLINKINDRQHIAALKKAYSVLAQATTNVLSENISMQNILEANDNDSLRDMYKKYLTIIKTCDRGSIDGNCWVQAEDWHRLNGVDAWSNDDASGVILNDGMFVLFSYYSPNCDYNTGVMTENGYVNSTVPVCGAVSVDVNGFKGPNVMGKDIFFFYIAKDRLVPFGTAGTQTGLNDMYACGGDGDGEACTAEYIGNLKVEHLKHKP